MKANLLHPKIHNVRLHNYEKHLLGYCDNKVGRHESLYIFLLNVIMRHHAQDLSTMFVNIKMADLPTTVDHLREHLQTFLDSRIIDKLIRFRIVLRGTHEYWSK